MEKQRKAGILLAISSLPSEYGIGTFGKSAYEFVNFLKKANQSYWQILPLGHTSYGDSPYQTFSSFAGNPYYIDYEGKSYPAYCLDPNKNANGNVKIEAVIGAKTSNKFYKG